MVARSITPRRLRVSVSEAVTRIAEAGAAGLAALKRDHEHVGCGVAFSAITATRADQHAIANLLACARGRSRSAAAGVQRRREVGGDARKHARLLRDPRHGPGREHLRLFCRLENGTEAELDELGFDLPHIVVINGMRKPNAQLFSDAEYRKHVRNLGDAYLGDVPRRFAV